jgi:hypothetical protein
MKAILRCTDAESLARCRNYCAERSIEILAEPPTLSDALALARDQQALLIGDSLADLAPSLAELRTITHALAAHGAHWIAVGSGLSSSQRPVRTLLDHLYALEHARRSRACAEGKRKASDAGFRVTRPHLVRFGWKVDPADPRRITEHPEEQLLLAEILRLHAEGLNQSAIAAELNRRGHRNRAGKSWQQGSIRAIVGRATVRKIA